MCFEQRVTLINQTLKIKSENENVTELNIDNSLNGDKSKRLRLRVTDGKQKLAKNNKKLDFPSEEYLGSLTNDQI